MGFNQPGSLSSPFFFDLVTAQKIARARRATRDKMKAEAFLSPPQSFAREKDAGELART